jgi:hypothetical protein
MPQPNRMARAAGWLMLPLLAGFWLRPEAVTTASAAAMAAWWATAVPIIFPGYLAAAAAARALGRPRPALLLLGLATLPAVTGSLVLGSLRHRSVSPGTAEILWLWANFTCPLLLPGAGRLIMPVLGGGLLVAIAGTLVLGRHPDPPELPLAAGWPSLALEAMNWATLFGAGLVLVAWAGALFPSPVWWLLLAEPITQARGPIGLLAFALGTNGLVFLIPQLVAARQAGLPALRLMGWRLLAGLVAWGLTALPVIR